MLKDNRTLYIRLFLCASFHIILSFKWAIKQNMHHTVKKSILNDNIDLSPENSGSLLKRVTRRGNPTVGFPCSKDSVEIKWKIRVVGQSEVAHSSDALEEPFVFVLGAIPREVILGWEICVPTMLEGEIAELMLTPDYGFGSKGAPPMIPPNATLVCDLEIIKITPSITRTYKSVGINESIKDELLAKIDSGESIIAEDVMQNKPITETKSESDRIFFNGAFTGFNEYQYLNSQLKTICNI